MPKPFLAYESFLYVINQLDEKWHIQRGGLNRKKIRLGEKNYYCPITYVCEFITGQWFPDWEQDKAAEALPLEKNLARLILWAADDIYTEDPKVAKIRSELLIATKLSDKI